MLLCRRCRFLAVCKGWRSLEQSLPRLWQAIAYGPGRAACEAGQVAGWLRWLAAASGRWAPGAVQVLELDFRGNRHISTFLNIFESDSEDIWESDSSIETWESYCTLLANAVESVLRRHAGSLQRLDIHSYDHLPDIKSGTGSAALLATLQGRFAGLLEILRALALNGIP